MKKLGGIEKEFSELSCNVTYEDFHLPTGRWKAIYFNYSPKTKRIFESPPTKSHQDVFSLQNASPCHSTSSQINLYSHALPINMQAGIDILKLTITKTLKVIATINKGFSALKRQTRIDFSSQAFTTRSLNHGAYFIFFILLTFLTNLLG